MAPHEPSDSGSGMGGTSDESDGLFSGFINTQDEVSTGGGTIKIATMSNPVKWGRLGQSIALGLIGTLSIVGQSIPLSIGAAIASLFDAAVSFIGGVNAQQKSINTGTTQIPISELSTGGGVTVTEWTGTGLIGTIAPVLNVVTNDLWVATVSQFGILGYPVAVAIDLAMLYVLVVGTSSAIDRLTGAA